MTINIKLLIYLLALLSIMTVNSLLPAMPILQHYFTTTKSGIGLTMSAYMLGLACGIPIYGAMSDHISTSKVLIFGLALYITANIAGIYSTSITTFIITRFLTGLSAASALCLWQIVVFTYFEKQAKQLINSGFMLIGAMPALAPMLGGFVLAYDNWQGILVTLILLAAFAAALTLSLPTPNASSSIKSTKEPLVFAIIKQYRCLCHDGEFVTLALVSACIYMSVYTYLAQVPFLLTQLHFSTQDLSLFFIPISIAFILGSLLSKYLLAKGADFNTLFMLTIIIFMVAFVVVLVTDIMAITLSGWLLATPFFIFTLGAGIGMPNLVSQALTLHPQSRGTAASAIGLLQNLAAFLFSGIGAYLTHYGYQGLVFSYVFLAGLPLAGFIMYRLVDRNNTSALRKRTA